MATSVEDTSGSFTWGAPMPLVTPSTQEAR